MNNIKNKIFNFAYSILDNIGVLEYLADKRELVETTMKTSKRIIQYLILYKYYINKLDTTNAYKYLNFASNECGKITSISLGTNNKKYRSNAIRKGFDMASLFDNRQIKREVSIAFIVNMIQKNNVDVNYLSSFSAMMINKLITILSEYKKTVDLNEFVE